MQTLNNTLGWINGNSGVLQFVISLVVLPFLNKLRLRYQNKEAVGTVLGAMERGAELAVTALQAGQIGTKAAAIELVLNYAKQSYPDRVSELNASEDKLREMATAAIGPVERAAKALSELKDGPFSGLLDAATGAVAKSVVVKR